MKKLIALLLAFIMLLSFAACELGGEDGTEAKDPEKTEDIKNNDNTDDNNKDDPTPGTTTAEKCYFCYDLSSPSDRKCDECGNWVYPYGEIWTSEVPENLKVLVDDGTFFYAVEKIGEEFYVKMWSDKSEMDKGTVPYEDFYRLTEHYARYTAGNADQAEWSTKNAFQTKYADVYELFAVAILQNLAGGTVSAMIEDCKDIASSGTETIAGKECVIKEYSSLFGTEYKVWFWNNMPLKKMYKDTNMTEYSLLWEIYEWDASITAFSSDMPA